MALTTLQRQINGAKGGRPKGGKNKPTLIKELVKRKFDQRVLRIQDRLLNAQATLAIGQTFLYKIEKEWIKTGTKKNGEENGYWKNKKPVLVISQGEIEDYLTELAENNGSLDSDDDPSATYYFMTTKEPNNSAVDSLLDRVHGRAKESIEHTGEVKFSLKELASRRSALAEGNKKLEPPKQEENIIDAEFTSAKKNP